MSCIYEVRLYRGTTAVVVVVVVDTHNEIPGISSTGIIRTMIPGIREYI